MKVHLMFRDRDFDVNRELPWSASALADDLHVDVLVAAMSGEDAYVANVARHALLDGLVDRDTTIYRQAVLRDCVEHESSVRSLYDLALEALNIERKSFWLGTLARHPGSVLYRAQELLGGLLDVLRRLRARADAAGARFASEGFSVMFAALRDELNDEYLAAITRYVRKLRFEDGIFVSARLGEGNVGTDYVLRHEESAHANGGWLRRVLAPASSDTRSFTLHPRDESGARALARLRDIAVNSVADSAARSADHVVGFFARLRDELAFYLSCLRLRARLTELGMPVTLPEPAAADERRHDARGLYDPSLALTSRTPVVGNDLHADGKAIFVITGANQGGKSSFLRALGLAQIMMQCGTFVPADSFSANVCPRVFTHFKREEDATMRSGKLDEELSRMSEIVERLVPNSLVLFNESFSSTNEREGSEIATQVALALADARVQLFFVTHLHEFADALRRADVPALFLRAERLEDGTRTFKLLEGLPLETSHGRDVYETVFSQPSTT